jgi:outer membrane protein assembly factor BamB
MEPTSPRKIWQFNLSGKMTAPLVLDAGSIYAAGLDTKLYKLNSMTGKPVWENPFLAGDAIRDPVILGKTCVYIYTVNTGLHAVDKQTGKAVWNLPRGRSVLSEQGDQSYVYVQPGVLAQMDNSSGKEKLSVNMAGVDRYAVNATADSVLYLADKKGRVMAAEPIPEDKPGTAKP